MIRRARPPSLRDLPVQLRHLILVLAAAAVATPAVADAQERALDRPAECHYIDCALGIAPVWNGLAVVRGAQEARVANLNFFWARDITGAFPGAAASADSARRHGRGAVRLRNRAAVLTNLGGALVAAAVVRRAAGSRDDGLDLALGGVGATMFAVSVPLHFAADGALSRAVWWYNARF